MALGIFAVGNILFGHFEEHRPKWRRLAKFVLILAVVLTLSATVGRGWAFGFLGTLSLAALYVHFGVWLPRQGINGWTGEPRDRYLELVTRRRGGTERSEA